MVYVDLEPRYVKVLLRWCRVPERVVLRAAAGVTGLDVRRAAPAGAPRGSPTRNLDAMKRVTSLTTSLSDEIATDGWTALLADVLGTEPATAYFHRCFPKTDIWPYFLAVAITREAIGDDTSELVVAWHANWPREWRPAVADQLRAFDARLFEWPHWYTRFAGYASNISSAAHCVALIASMTARQGVRERPRESVPIAIEFVEARRLGGGTSDTNFFEDGRRVRRDDILFVLTRHQERVLRSVHVDARQDSRQARQLGFRVVYWRDLGYSRASVGRFARAARQIAGRLARRGPAAIGSAALAHSAARAWRDILDWQMLFDSYAPALVLHTQNPDGQAGGRIDSAVVTGLARRAGSRTVGYQNRIVYDRVFEDSFDCYDEYLAWGEGWREALGRPANAFLGRIRPVGCVHNEGTPEAVPRPVPDHGPRVVIFTNELGGHLFPASVTLNFLHACMSLAELHPECTFRVKTKDPEMVDALLADPGLRRHHDQVRTTFEFLRLARHETAPVIRESDIVIATAWTTPGSDALLVGKRVLFYNELRGGGLAFAALPDLVAEDPVELRQLFDKACGDYTSYARDHAALLARLDPFHDGDTRRRIIDALLGTCEVPEQTAR